MSKEKVRNLFTKKNVNFNYSPDKCPICKSNIAPTFLYGALYGETNSSTKCDILNYCVACSSTFLSTYTAYPKDKDGTEYDSNLVCSGPKSFEKRNFEPDFENTFSLFVEIYNQSLAAETANLIQVAGVGYRKALETLVKDFIIEFYPDKKDKVLETSLANCIKHHIDDTDIQTLAEACKDLGNDETHYVKELKYDLDSLKRLLDGLIFFINKKLIVKFAETVIQNGDQP